MLVYQFENIRKSKAGEMENLQVSGWLADTKGIEIKISVTDAGNKELHADISRISRPDVDSIFSKNKKPAGFHLDITCQSLAHTRCVITNGEEEKVFEIDTLSPCGNINRSLLPWNEKIKYYLSLVPIYSHYLFLSSGLVLKYIKRWLCKHSPRFQKFYMQYIYPLFHIEKKVKVSLLSENNSPWGEHLLLVSHFADGSGAAKLLLSIAEILHGFGFNLHIVLLRDGELHETFCHYGTVDVIHNEHDFEMKLQEWEPLHIKKAFLNTALSGFYAPLLKRYGFFIITLVHEMWHTIRDIQGEEAAKNLQTASDRIILPSLHIAEDWEKHQKSFPREKIIIMPQPDFHSDLQPISEEQKKLAHIELCTELGIPKNSFIVIGCGSLEKRKAPDVFFKTASKIILQNPNIHFIWIGDKGNVNYRNKIDFLIAPIAKNARILSYRKLNKYYYGADLFFLPSKEDPFPTVSLLAAKVAMPLVFCKQSTGIRDLFGEVEGCSCKTYGERSFISMILRFAADSDFCRKQGLAIQQIYQKMYSFQEYVWRLFELTGNTLPKITAIIPNYNYAGFLERRVQSIVSQTFPVYELLILDDCSTDNSDQTAEKLIQQYAPVFSDRMRYIKNEKNIGVFRQWQKGVSLASGDFIWIAEADDECLPEMLSKLVHAFIFDPKVVLAYAQSALMDEKSILYAQDFRPQTDMISGVKWKKSYIGDAKTEIETALGIKNTIPNASAVLFRKEIFSKIPPEIFSYKAAGDWFAYLHIVEGKRIAFCSDSLNLYRRHPNSIISKNPDLLLKEIKQLDQLIMQRFKLSPYSRYLNQKEYEDTSLLLRGEYDEEKLDTLRHTAVQKDPEIDYLYLPENFDQTLLKKYLTDTEKKYIYICLADPLASLSPDLTEQCLASIHMFWEDDIKYSDFFCFFKPICRKCDR